MNQKVKITNHKTLILQAFLLAITIFICPPNSFSNANNIHHNLIPNHENHYGILDTGILVNCSTPINHALNKSTSQSSTNSIGGTSDKAVDGNTKGDFWGSGSTAFTAWENNPWWEVNLQVDIDIEEIKIYNRTDCCYKFLTNYYIFVSSVPFASTDLNETINQPGVQSYFQETVAGSPSIIPIQQNGKYVRIQITTSGFIGLAEVEVMGCATGSNPCPIAGTSCDDDNTDTVDDIEDGNCNCEGTIVTTPSDCSTPTNIAMSGTASQSSTQFEAEASRAIDGNTNGQFWGDQNTISLTNWEKHAWWELDLGELSDIKYLNIWNRVDCCTEFLSNYHLFISETPFNSKDLDETINQQGVIDFFQDSVAQTPTLININRTGRYIRIQLNA